MIISRKFIFIHQAKTGGTFVTKALHKLHHRGMTRVLLKIARMLRHTELQAQIGFYNMQSVGNPKHSGVIFIPKQHSSKAIVTTIRNPYDWYVSHYEFGWFRKHPEEGGIREELCKKWPHYPSLTFEEFVSFANEKWFWGTQEGVMSDMRIGWLTSSLIQMLCRNPMEALNRLERYDDFSQYVKKCTEGVTFLKMENLNEELYSFLLKQGFSHNSLKFILELGKINPTWGGRSADQKWESYYTPELRSLVRHRERLLFELFPAYDT